MYHHTMQTIKKSIQSMDGSIRSSRKSSKVKLSLITSVKDKMITLSVNFGKEMNGKINSCIARRRYRAASLSSMSAMATMLVCAITVIG